MERLEQDLEQLNKAIKTLESALCLQQEVAKTNNQAIWQLKIQLLSVLNIPTSHFGKSLS